MGLFKNIGRVIRHEAPAAERTVAHEVENEGERIARNVAEANARAVDHRAAEATRRHSEAQAARARARATKSTGGAVNFYPPPPTRPAPPRMPGRPAPPRASAPGRGAGVAPTDWRKTRRTRASAGGPRTRGTTARPGSPGPRPAGALPPAGGTRKGKPPRTPRPPGRGRRAAAQGGKRAASWVKANPGKTVIAGTGAVTAGAMIRRTGPATDKSRGYNQNSIYGF